MRRGDSALWWRALSGSRGAGITDGGEYNGGEALCQRRVLAHPECRRATVRPRCACSL